MITCPPPGKKNEKEGKRHSSNTVRLPCFGRRVCWQVLPAKEAALPCESDGSAWLTPTNSGILQHQALKHEALEHGQAVLAL